MPWAARATVRRVMESWLMRLAAASARAAAAALAEAWALRAEFSVSPSVLSAVATMAPICDCRLRVVASAAVLAAASSFGSSRAITSPAFTSWPSVTVSRSIRPVIWAATITWLASTVPSSTRFPEWSLVK